MTRARCWNAFRAFGPPSVQSILQVQQRHRNDPQRVCPRKWSRLQKSKIVLTTICCKWRATRKRKTKDACARWRRSIQAEVEHLRELSKQKQAVLDECVAQIDRCILDCIGKIAASHQSYARLSATQRRLAELGAPTEVLHLPEQSTDLIASRLDHLRQEGKI